MIRILIADDHAIVRDGLRLILESHGEMTVIAETADGLEAVKQAQIMKPGVIIMAISMPNLNGIEATRRILESNPGIRIVILSMYASSEDIFRALKAGAIGYLMKESAGIEVRDAVQAAFTGKRYLSRKVDDIVIDSYMEQQNLSESHSPIEKLSSREREVLQLVAEGKTSSEIAGLLFLSVKTIETYRSRLMQKLNLKDIPALVKLAVSQGLV
ncbi:MAG: response regulator transcription factor, partial [Bacteroidota bacterium]